MPAVPHPSLSLCFQYCLASWTMFGFGPWSFILIFFVSAVQTLLKAVLQVQTIASLNWLWFSVCEIAEKGKNLKNLDCSSERLLLWVRGPDTLSEDSRVECSRLEKLRGHELDVKPHHKDWKGFSFCIIPHFLLISYCLIIELVHTKCMQQIIQGFLTV